MPINTRIDGDPESIRAAAQWLRSTLSTAVHDCVTKVYGVRGNSETAWEGAAADAFRAKMASGGQKADYLAEESDRAGRSFDCYADDLHTAIVGRDRALQIAREGGLEIVDEQILDPGPAPTTPQALPSDGSATPQMVQAHNDAMKAQQIHSLKVAAYAEADEQMAHSRQIIEGAKTFGQNVWNDIRGKAILHVADLTNGTVGALAARHTTVLRREADSLTKQAARHIEHYLKSGGGSTSTAKYNLAAAEKARGQADDALRRADAWWLAWASTDCMTACPAACKMGSRMA
jgi:uncharacterized protein YukE